jgi:hypothetical protein
MTKEEIKDQIKNEKEKYFRIEEQKNEEILDLFIDTFLFDSTYGSDQGLQFTPEFQSLNVKLKSGDDGCMFMAESTDSMDREYESEIFRVYLRKTNPYTHQSEFDQIGLSYYTSSANSYTEFETDRIILLGKVAEIVKKHQRYEQGGLLQKYNHIISEYDTLENANGSVNINTSPGLYGRQLIDISDKVWELEEELEKIEQFEVDKRAEDRLKQAFSSKGIQIKKQDNGRRKSIKVKVGQAVCDVERIKILRYVNPETAKSVDVHFTVIPQIYNVEDETYTEGKRHTQTKYKIRLDRIYPYIID